MCRRSDWRYGPWSPPASGPSSQLSPSQRRSSNAVRSASFVDRATSVSSMRRMNVPPEPRASSQLKSAVRALPTCSWPVGLGAKRSLISFQAGPKGPALLSVPVCRVLLDPADECYRMNRYGFARACRVDALVGLALHAHLARVDTKRRRKAGAHGIDVRHELRPLGNDDHVDVPHR